MFRDLSAKNLLFHPGPAHRNCLEAEKAFGGLVFGWLVWFGGEMGVWLLYNKR